jgi:hypothetical protein
MKRRSFLQSVSALALWPWRSPSPEPVIKRFDDGYWIDVGILRCLTYADGAGTSLTFGVFIITQLPGGWEESRKLPTERLQQELKAVGFPVVTEIWGSFLVLVATMTSCPTPQDIAERLEQVLAKCDPKLLFYDWERLEQASVDIRTILEP